MFSKLFRNKSNVNMHEAIDAKAFKPLLKENFAPALREYGFKGSGFKYTKQVGHYLYAVNIQPSRYDGKCCIEMGVGVDFIPYGLDHKIPSEKFTSYLAHSRTRLAPKGESDYWWDYGNSIEEAKTSIESMTNIFKDYGIHYFEHFKDFPNPLDEITLKDIEDNSDKLTKLHLFLNPYLFFARVHVYLGDKEKGIEFAKSGYDRLDKVKSEISYEKDPTTGTIHVKGGNNPEKIIAIYEKLMKGEFI